MEKIMRTSMLEKAVRDGEALYRGARAVILLDNDGNVVETIDREKDSWINVLVILGPITIDETHIATAVRGEIGFGKMVPYQKTRRLEGDKWISFRQRTFHQPLSIQEQEVILPQISRLVQEIVDKSVMHRKRLTYFKNFKSDSQVYGVGKFVTIPDDLPLLQFVCLAKDMHTRTNGHLSEFASRIRLGLSELTYAVYPPNELKRLKAVRYIAFNLSEANYSEHILDILRAKIGKRGSKARELFEQILEVHNIQPVAGNQKYLALKEHYRDKEKTLVSLTPLDVVTLAKRVARREKKNPPNHNCALRCIRVEVRPSQKAIQLHVTRNFPETLAA